MSDYQPKVGDKVMVGEHGPYEVEDVRPGEAHIATPVFGTWALTAWLTPAPEPEPDEPTAPGALVRTGTGSYAVHNGESWTIAGGAWSWPWDQLIRPVSVVLADPAEVEALREERDQWESDYQEAMRQVAGLTRQGSDLVGRVDEERRFGADEKRRADELQRRIDKALTIANDPDHSASFPNPVIRSFLRGES